MVVWELFLIIQTVGWKVPVCLRHTRRVGDELLSCVTGRQMLSVCSVPFSRASPLRDVREYKLRPKTCL